MIHCAAAPPVRETLRTWVWAIGLTVAAWLLVRTFLYEAFRIPSQSMENTLLPGDLLFVNKAIYGAAIPFSTRRLPALREPRRGELVVFQSVEQPEMSVVKRVAGLAGDTLEMHGGVLFRNGVPVAEPYHRHTDPAKSETPEWRERMRAWQVRHLARDTAGYAADLQEWGPIVVPPESLFVLGDNREFSYDGRYWGFLPRDHLRGKPVLIYYSFQPDGGRKLAAFTAVRWDRLFTLPR